MPAPTGRTTKNNLPYPTETDGADPARDIKALAEAIDLVLEPNARVPVGGEAEYAGENDPSTTWMVENGRELSRTTYAALFAIIGIKWGAGNGSTTFNIPDCRGRSSVGAGVGAGLTNRELGKTYGSETHTLTIAEMPKHSHPVVENSTAVSNAAQVLAYSSVAGQVVYEPIGGIENGTQPIVAVGGGAAHSVMQPVIAKNKIIRVL